MLRNPDLLDALEGQKGEEEVIDQIHKDLDRQFPNHEMFALRGGLGQTNLLRILKAFSIHRPEIGYCQV